jgi:ankyrin repeat protein
VNTPNNNGKTPVYIAALNGHVEAIRALAEKGAHVDTPDNNGKTPVFIAAEKGHQDVVNLLREYGAKDLSDSTIL